ncbi:MAG: DUF2232 domain-containing protein, partial [Alphaproteobacteria bacterium]|nr:DUF2232 domain-containing protein [Alphaproteobacteria bacterium]
IAIAAGLVSGLLQAALSLPAAGGILLAYIAPLPLFLAGLGLGVRGAILAVLVAGGLNVLFAGAGFAAVQAMFYGIPVVVICRQALLSRTDAQGHANWYPPGHLLLWLSGMAMAGLAIGLAGLSLFGDGLMAYLQAVMAPFAEQFPDAEQREVLLALVDYLPAFFAVSWSLGLIFNGALAQGLLVRFGYNVAPSPELADIRLPMAWIGTLLAALLLSSLTGLLGVVGKTLAAIAIVPYFVLGLGVVHGFFRAWKGRLAILILFYGLLFLWPLPAFVAGLGLLNAVLRLARGNDLGNAGGAGDRGGSADKEE